MLGLIGFLATAALTGFGYWQARKFVQTKLQYVDAAHGIGAAVVAGLGAMLIAWPFAWLLPLIGTGTAVLFGIAVGVGVATGARDNKRRLTSGY
jgi:hypothetical protein